MSVASRVNNLATRVSNYLRDSISPRLLPAGGGAGQVLAKTSATDYATQWVNQGGGGGSVSGVTVEINSSTPYVSKSFAVSVPGANLGAKVICSPSLDMPAGVPSDELEADPITVAGRVSASGVVTLLVASVNNSPIGGKRNINLVLA